VWTNKGVTAMIMFWIRDEKRRRMKHFFKKSSGLL
jgi:hypothetical protein